MCTFLSLRLEVKCTSGSWGIVSKRHYESNQLVLISFFCAEGRLLTSPAFWAWHRWDGLLLPGCLAGSPAAAWAGTLPLNQAARQKEEKGKQRGGNHCPAEHNKVSRLLLDPFRWTVLPVLMCVF